MRPSLLLMPSHKRESATLPLLPTPRHKRGYQQVAHTRPRAHTTTRSVPAPVSVPPIVRSCLMMHQQLMKLRMMHSWVT
jgi:hypothetical protein